MTPVAEDLPPELVAADRWLLWRHENGTKVPRVAKNPERRGSSTDPATWCSFAEAAAALPFSNCDGLGFVLGDGFGGSDLDGCRNPETGELTDWAQDAVERFASYAEISPSGTGVKIFTFGGPDELPGNVLPMPGPAINGKRPQMECYARGRYFAVTRQRLAGSPLALSDGALGWRLLAEHTNSSGNGSANPVEDTIPEGGRNAILTSLGGTMRRRGMAEQEIRAALAEVNRLRCRPPLSDREVAAVAHSCARYTPTDWPDPEAIEKEVHRLRVRREAARIVALDATDGPAEPRSWTLAELLADPEAVAVPTPVLRHLAWPGRATLLAAPEKLGKSTLLAAAVAALTQGREFLGAPTDGVGAIVLWATEEHPGDVARRLADFGADPASVAIMQWGADPIAEIRAETDARRPVLVVIDTLTALAEHAAPESGSASQWASIMRPLVRMARETGAALVIVHHARKSDGTYRDSTEIGAAVDAIVEMSGVPTGTVRRLTWRGRYGRGSVAVQLQGHRFELTDARFGGEIEAAVVEHIRLNPGCPGKSIERGVHGRRDAVQAAVGALLKRGRIVNLGDRSRHAYHLSETAPSLPGTSPTGGEVLTFKPPPEGVTF